MSCSPQSLSELAFLPTHCTHRNWWYIFSSFRSRWWQNTMGFHKIPTFLSHAVRR